MESAEKEICCLFCKNKFEGKPTVVYPKGLENIRQIAKNRDFELQEEIRKKSRTGEAILAHADCRKRFTDKRKSVDSQPTNSKGLRTKFIWKTLCFFCASFVKRLSTKITSHQRNFPEL